MTIPSSHQDAAIAYVAAHGGQGWREVRAGMGISCPAVHVTMYLLKKLWKEGRLEKRGLDAYYVPPAKTAGTAP